MTVSSLHGSPFGGTASGKRSLLCALVSVTTCLAACTRTLPAPTASLAGFDVKLDFAGAPAGVAGTCPFTLPDGTSVTDLCPGEAGTITSPIGYPGDEFVQAKLDIRAVSTTRTSAEDTSAFPLNGLVTVGLRAGEIFGALTQVNLVDGRADGVVVRLRRTPGPTYIWVEDNLPRSDGTPPSFAAGLTDTPLYFDQPSIAEIQKTNDECCSPVDGQRVEVTRGQMYVTRITGSGFNVQDITTPDSGGLFVFAFNGIEGLRTGARLLSLAGGITEFQSSTQLTEPVFTPVNGICAASRDVEGGEDRSEDESGTAVVKCPRGTACLRDSEGVSRCTPDSDAALDKLGRRVCTIGGTNTCPAGTSCQTFEGQGGTFCQVVPLPMIAEAWPEAPFCGPLSTVRTPAVEGLEGSLVRISSASANGVRFGGLPVCKKPEGNDPLHAVRSTCNLTTLVEGHPKAVDAPDCTLAANGDTVLRDDKGSPCFRGNQACLDDGRTADTLQSTCNASSSLPRCVLAEAGQPVLKDAKGNVCRGTLDDFITSGFFDFGQAKALFEDEAGLTRCATLNFDGVSGFNAIDMQERGDRWTSVTGTLRQVRFQSGTSFWTVDVRFIEDLEPLTP